MDLIVKMRVKPGDKHVSKATIKMYTAEGADMGGQVLLEGETAETNLTIPPGGECRITEATLPLVYDPVQHAAMPADFTPNDPLTDPNRPVVTPQDKDAHAKVAAKSDYKK